MAKDARRARLAARHAELDIQIAAEYKRPLPDSLRLTMLKRMKLRAKEEMDAIAAARPDERRV